MVGTPRARRTTRNTKLKVDFTGVTVRKLVPEGRHSFEVKEVKKDKGPNGEYLEVRSAVINDSDFEGAEIYDNLSLSPKALWRLKSFLDALGFETDGEIELDPAEMVEQVFDADIFHDTSYDSRPRAKVAEYYPVGDGDEASETEEDSEVAEDDEGEETSGSDDGGAEEGEVVITEEDIQDMSKEEIQELLEELEVEVKLVGSVAMCRKKAIAALKEAGYV